VVPLVYEASAVAVVGAAVGSALGHGCAWSAVLVAVALVAWGRGERIRRARLAVFGWLAGTWIASWGLNPTTFVVVAASFYSIRAVMREAVHPLARDARSTPLRSDLLWCAAYATFVYATPPNLIRFVLTILIARASTGIGMTLVARVIQTTGATDDLLWPAAKIFATFAAHTWFVIRLSASLSHSPQQPPRP
jgi:hypothetical protein